MRFHVSVELGFGVEAVLAYRANDRLNMNGLMRQCMSHQVALRAKACSTDLTEELSDVQVGEFYVFDELGLLCVVLRAHVADVVGRVVDSFMRSEACLSLEGFSAGLWRKEVEIPQKQVLSLNLQDK